MILTTIFTNIPTFTIVFVFDIQTNALIDLIRSKLVSSAALTVIAGSYVLQQWSQQCLTKALFALFWNHLPIKK